MVTSNPLQLNNSPQVFAVPGGISGSAQLLIQFDTAPSAGTVTVERRAPGVQSWSPLAKGTAKSITSGSLSLRIDGAVGSIRVTFTGLTGGVAPILWVDTNPTPQGLFNGLAAVTSQNYIEANTKNGVQFYIQHSPPTIPAATTHNIVFTTGAKPVLVKAREMYAIGASLSLQVFKQPTFTAGSGTPVVVQNFNDIAPVATTVLIRSGVAVTAVGTPWGDPQRLFGASVSGQRTGSGLAPGGDRVLKANSTYLIQIKNNDSGGGAAAEVDYFLSWYEGDSDIPL